MSNRQNIFYLGIAVLLLLASPSQACRTRLNEQSIFFDKIPQFTDGSPFAAKIKILKLEANGKITFARARVDKVMVGNAPAREIRIRIPAPTSCGPFVRVGDQGMVVGEFSALGVLEPAVQTGSEREENQHK